MVYKNTLDGITPEHLLHFCKGWRIPLAGQKLYDILKNSTYFVLAVAENGNVVGFVNALSDKIHFAFIPMLEVLPEYQNQDIGTKLMESMFELLKNIPCIDLTCDKELQPYYDKLGMIKSRGMVLRKYLSPDEIAWYKENED